MKKLLKVFLLYFIGGLLVYSNSLNNKFLMDDYVFLSNPVQSATQFMTAQWDPYREQALGVVDKQDNPGYYRPMAHMVLDICYASFKNNFWQYHLFNLFLFVCAAFLIYVLMGKVSGNYPLAFGVGLCYLIHPINGIIVNYISAIVFAFQVIFMLLTILSLWGSLEKKNDRGLYYLSLFFSFLSLFWNESGIMTPFYISALVLLYRKEAIKHKVLYLFPYFLIGFLYLVFRSIFLGTHEDILRQIGIYHMTGGMYVAALFKVYSWYISKLFFPQGIVMQWAIPIPQGHLFLNILGAGLLSMVFYLLFVRYSKEKICLLGLAWLLIGFAPVSLAAFRMPGNGVQIEPHWFVFSSIGFFMLVSYCCLKVLGRMRIIGPILLTMLALTWGSASYAYNQLWADQKTYALYWSQQVPNLKSTYCFLAEAYQQEGDLRASRKYARMALSGNLSDINMYNYIGLIDAAQDGNWKEAESIFKKAIAIDPLSAVTYNNLGTVYLKQGQWDRAKEVFQRASLLNPLLMGPRIGLASIAVERAEYQKAIDLCLENLAIVNNDLETLSLLIDIYIHEKDHVSLKKYASVLINTENDPKILTDLGIHMAKHQAPQIAMDCFRKAIQSNPGYKDAYFAAGVLFANRGMYDQAVEIWKIGSTIDPMDRRFVVNMAKARFLKTR